MKKTLCTLLALCLLLLPASAQEMQMHVCAMKGPTAMGMAGLSAASYDIEVCASTDELVPRLVRGEVDIAAIPANLAAVLYNRTGGEICVLAINTLGVLYIAERGESVKDVSDLRGRTIYTAGKGATPEHVLKHTLSACGLVPGTDLMIEYKSEHSECLAALLRDEHALALLPQPFLTAAQQNAPDVRTAIDLSEQWEHAVSDGSALITGVLVVRRSFMEEQSEALRQFLSDYASSVEYVYAQPEEASQVIERMGVVPAEIARAALPYCGITLIEGEDMRTKLSGYLQVLYEADPASVGGAMPGEDFYVA